VDAYPGASEQSPPKSVRARKCTRRGSSHGPPTRPCTAVPISASVTDADFRGVQLQDALLGSAKFARTNLSGSNLTGANLHATDFRDANLTQSNLHGAILSRTDFRDADLTRVEGAQFDTRLVLEAELKRICGVDLTSIDGVNVMTALTIISEIGTDMTSWSAGSLQALHRSSPHPRTPAPRRPRPIWSR
jgi:hypothetical protein